MWKWFEQYFTFSRGEKNGILTLLFISILFLIFPSVYLRFKPVLHSKNLLYDKEVNAFMYDYNSKKQLALETDSANNADETLTTIFNPYASTALTERCKLKVKQPAEYFYFDPNTIGISDWEKLGFSPKQAAIIEKAKAKGYKFYKPEDLKSIYVVDEKNYERVAPYIKIKSNVYAKKEYTKTVYPEKKPVKYTLDINTADSSLFERQRGIGPSLASRIIKYRTRLGGFISPEQIKEVWNFPDSTYQSLEANFMIKEATINKVNVNTADFKTMGTHPYINYTFAKVIEAYRKQHGHFKAIEDLNKIPIMTDSIYKRMMPYISID